MDAKEAALAVDRARWWVLSNADSRVVFYGMLCMKLRDRFETDGAITQTAATDGKNIFWNLAFLDGRDDEEIRYILLHETMHNAHLHPWRLPADQEGNEAGDHAINLTLNTIPGIRMPEGGLADPQYAGLAEEEILAKLRARKTNGGNTGKQGTGTQQGQNATPQQPAPGQGQPDPCGTFLQPGIGNDPATPPTQAQSDQLRASWEHAVVQASHLEHKKGLGSLPADLQRQLERVNARHIDWKRELADFVKTAVSQRNDWARPARRHAWQPVIYPSKRRDAVGTIIFARDTSSSVDDKTESLYAACVTNAMQETGCDAIVIDCDEAIQAEFRLTQGEPCPLKADGGGGTNFCPVFERAQALVDAGETIAGVVYLTDGEGRSPRQDPGIPTLWIQTPLGYPLHERYTPTFGSIVRVEPL
jgi:predicted metal-dependent peptidase